MDYLVELKKLPENIQDILISFFGAQINREIITENNLSEEQGSLFIDLVNDIYLKIINIENLELEISHRLKLDPKRANNLSVDIVGKKLLIADDYFQGQAVSFLQKKGVDLTIFSNIVAKELAEIEKEKEIMKQDGPIESFNDILSESLDSPEARNKSKNDCLLLFKEDLAKILSLGSDFNDIISDVNDDLLEFIQDDVFHKELENLLYKNNEDVITRVKPVLNNISEKGTISNWIKDFIVFHGSNNFNDIVLAEYLVNSSSAKKLSASDKKKIKRLLKIYRNIAFFPDSMENRGDDWEIIPLEQDVEIKDSLILEKSKKNITESRTPDITSVIPNRPSNSIPPSPQDRLISELTLMLQDYSLDSLEYKTIAQELKRLQNKK